MKKIIFCILLFTLLIGANACKKHDDVNLPVRISFFNITPQTVASTEKAWITVSLANVDKDSILVKALADYGQVSPAITSSTGNPVYLEYTAPKVTVNETLYVTITIILMDAEGNELDRVEGRVTVKG